MHLISYINIYIIIYLNTYISCIVEFDHPRSRCYELMTNICKLGNHETNSKIEEGHDPFDFLTPSYCNPNQCY